MRRWLAIIVVTPMGCITVPVASDEVRTEELVPHILVETTAEASLVQVTLEVDGGLFDGPVFLGVGDRLLARADGVEYELDPLPDVGGDDPVYGVEIPVTRGGAWIQVELEREFDEGARYSGVALAEDFALQQPLADSMRSRSADPLTVIYSAESGDDLYQPAARSMALEVLGDCFGVLKLESLSDIGWFELAAGTLVGGDTCAAMLTVSREGGVGQVDPNFGQGATIRSIQRRSVSFWSAP